MANETPRPMKKFNRNIFHKVGKKLEKLEQSLVVTPNLSSRSQLSLNDLSSNYPSQDSEHNEGRDDNVSILSVPHTHKTSAQAMFPHQHSDPMSRSHSAAVLHDENFNGQWQTDRRQHFKPIIKDRTTKYDQEMQVVCKDMMENRTVNLYNYRDYDRKVSLLRIAVSFNAPKVTVPVILFLENTLSKSIFYELIKQHPSAVRNYLNMAKLYLENDSYISMLKQFGKNEEVGIIRIRQASEINDINSKMTLLDQAAIEINSHPWWHLQIAEYQHLLHKQRELQRSILSSQSNINLENRTVLDTYKSLFDIEFRRQKFNRNIDKNTVDYSKEIERTFHMSPEMILCGKLSVIMQCGLRMHYDDFIHCATHQSIFGKKYTIAPENFADMVYNWIKFSGEGQEKASEQTTRFLNMIQDPGRRIHYAERFQNYDVAMDTIAFVLRDRVQLENLRKRIPRDHPSFNRATALLDNTKWRN
ncbi:unnamed protein product [Rotaria sordida]|uniref:Vps16 C-terminal domain-containing protein n=1 Tax=Rotaria sordida TaxID=392033 RepID=A0A818IQD0_9BILA|nr:unnamed protein product [Rotaria sordida]CAF3525287.1 unnamed protein product [Rotaria sordida]